MKLSQNIWIRNFLILFLFGLGAVLLGIIVPKLITVNTGQKEVNVSSPTTSVSPTNNPSINTDSNGCNSDLWKHVYNPSRLKIINECSEVSGTIDVIRIEKDGDDHILLKLDAGQENLINQKNISQQKGDLVSEPVCLHNVTQADAISSCENFKSNVTIPPIGTHVKVIGSFVLDTAHGWNEIHPVSQIIIN